MLVPRKKASMINPHSSSSKSNTRRRETNRTPKKLLIEERLHLLQQSYSSPSDTDIEDNNNTWSRPRVKSSFYTGSCSNSNNDKVWSMTSLLENCPSSPSPICSPVSSRASNNKLINLRVSESNRDDVLFVTPKETSSCLTEPENKNTSLQNEIQEVSTTEHIDQRFSLQPYGFTFPQPNIQRSNTENFHIQNQRAARISYVVHEPSEISESSNNNERSRNERACRQNWQLATVPPSRLSSVGEWNLSTNEGLYTSGDEENSASMIELKVEEMEAKFTAWKEARNFKFLTRLKKKEEGIEDWEKKEIVKAKQNLRHTEIKLEIKRRRVLEKARKKIEKAQKKAEARKMRERNATAKKISRSNKALEKISCTGKLLWKLACF